MIHLGLVLYINVIYNKYKFTSKYIDKCMYKSHRCFIPKQQGGETEKNTNKKNWSRHKSKLGVQKMEDKMPRKIDE